MKYRHANHAGNFADTVKHLVLVEILQALARKPTPFMYLETHAGRGRYNLPESELQAQHPNAPAISSEFYNGFGRLLHTRQLPSSLQNYVSLIKRLGTETQPDGLVTWYPGSPLIAAALMRPEDRAVLFELQTAEANILQTALHDLSPPTPRLFVHNADGYAGLRAHVPPQERRGLVLIDPAYELQEQEFTQALHALQQAYARWPTGIYAIWYPIKRRSSINRFHEETRNSGIRKILCAELCLFPDDSRVGLNGCGMLVVNPPWQLDTALNTALPELHRLLGGLPKTSARCAWLVPE